MAEKYKKELSDMQAKYKNINDFIFDSRTYSILNDKAHDAFLEHTVAKAETIDDARAY